MASQPSIGIGHVALTVGDLDRSARFYADVGLQPFSEGESLAILELRGGTHLLLLQRETGAPASAPERVDLMISGRTREELETYRSMLVQRGLQPSEIPDQPFYGHHMFRLRDPDGNEVLVATSHSELSLG